MNIIFIYNLGKSSKKNNGLFTVRLTGRGWTNASKDKCLDGQIQVNIKLIPGCVKIMIRWPSADPRRIAGKVPLSEYRQNIKRRPFAREGRFF